MEKGIAERMPFIIIAVIFGLVALFIMFKIFPNLLTQLQFALGLVKLSNAEKAILCSIHRCVDGCMSSKIQEISWEDKEETVWCQEGFCSYLPDSAAFQIHMFGRDIILNPELKICNTDYPINFSLKKSEKIEKSHLKLGSTTMSDVKCILVAGKSYGPNAWEIVAYATYEWVWPHLVNFWTTATGGKVSDNILIIAHGIGIKSFGETEDCVLANGIKIHDSFKEVTLNGNQEINITTLYFSSFPNPEVVFTILHKGRLTIE